MQYVASLEKQVPPAAVADWDALRTRLRNETPRVRSGIQTADIYRILFGAFPHREVYEATAIRQELRPPVTRLATRRIQCGGSLRLSSPVRNPEYRSQGSRGEEDVAVYVPRSPAPKRRIADRA